VLAERLEDVRLSRGGTRVAVEFIKGGRSGASMDIGRGLTLRREFDYLWLGVPNAEERSRSLTVPAEGSGTETVSLDGRVFRVSWKRDAQSERPESALSAENVLQVPSDAVLPLEVRARRPGDGIRLRGGRRKLKRLLIDCRVPVSERSRIPVLSDAQGRILWVWGVARAESRPAAGGLEETRQVPTMIEIEELESARNGSSG
jgi:tRNA(Ile)-lysidine synthase